MKRNYEDTYPQEVFDALYELYYGIWEGNMETYIIDDSYRDPKDQKYCPIVDEWLKSKGYKVGDEIIIAFDF